MIYHNKKLKTHKIQPVLNNNYYNKIKTVNNKKENIEKTLTEFIKIMKEKYFTVITMTVNSRL